MAPFGLSDHFTISLFPKIRNINTNKPRVVKSRDIRPSNKMALGRVLSTIDWSCLDLINSCEGKVDFFNKIVSDSLNLIMPIKIRTIHNNDAPWMSDKLKRSIKNRQRALQSGNSIEFKYYRNVVNMERKKCKSSYYDCKIKNLKHVKPRNWWSAVKKISGMNTITKPDLRSNLQIDDLDNLSDIEVANKINDKFLEPLQEFQPLQVTVPNNDSISNVLTVSELDVWNCLNSLNPWKNRVQTLEESYQRREARQREEIELLIIKHKDTVNQLEREKSDLQTGHARKISTLEANKLTEIERLNETHRRALDEVRSEHLAEINHLKKMKEQEISATMTAFSHTKSLQSLMEQVLNSTKQVEDLHHLVEVSHKSSQQERDITMKTKDEYLTQLQDRLLKQQTDNDEERTRLQNLVAKMEVQIREQSRKFEEDKWKLSQEDSRLKSLRVSLEEERRVTREQLEAERGLVQRTKEEFLSQQRQMMLDINEERRTLALERAEVSAAQRGMMNKEKQKHDNFTKLDAEQESARVRLAEDTAALDARETQLRRDQEELRREKRIFVDKHDKWNTEKDHIGKLGLELEKRAQEIDEVSLEAAKVREEGRKSLEVAQRMQVEIAQQANELEARVLLLQEKDRQVADERLASLKEKRELEVERRRGLCSRCSQSQSRPRTLDSTGKREPSARLSQSLDGSLSSRYATSRELITSPPPPRASSVHSLPPDLLVNTLDLKRTLRRWSQDKEQDEEFLAKESEFLNSLQDTRLSPLYRE
ncbi:Hypothetical predicted protein [Paramuricea clavata]|uniref:Fas-binding factor 1 C-terminal domain-containing protein n=1 Tax=Paramuricea clavata TaxID=317549 RepID=A0A7D9IYP7_PARCT|nr:Hypothetical predicted protein [Paramuricea clavata]